MGIIYINNTPYDVDNKKNLLQVCLSLGFNIPYFCWHPALNSAGACRLCAVKQFKDEHDTVGKIIMSCMTAASAGIRISTSDPEVLEFRKSVLEWLMTSHPHDCPVCDEGGECHLQDMTVMTGQTYRRYRFKKRTHNNQDMGPFIHHEMNRCIQCYRCVRFYRDYAAGKDLNVFGAHDHVYFGRPADGVLESNFSGNLVEVCPTGVFTDKTQRNHHSRKWDLQSAPSVCSHCAVGCNVTPGERYDSIRRIRNRYHGNVNGFFICDRGRFGYEFANDPRRIVTSKQKIDDRIWNEISSEETVKLMADLLSKGQRIAGIGSPRASLETNAALKELCGDEFYSGIPAVQHENLSLMLEIMKHCNAPAASLKDIENADAILILGEDIANTAPRMALSVAQSTRQAGFQISRNLGIPDWLDLPVREAAQEAHSPLLAIWPYLPLQTLDICDYHLTTPDKIASIGEQIARSISENTIPEANDIGQELDWVRKTVLALTHARRPVVISGAGCNSNSIIHSAGLIAQSLCDLKKDAKLALIPPENNSLGLMLLNPHPGIPNIKDEKNKIDVLIVVENDLYRRFPESVIDRMISATGHLIVIDYLPTKLSQKADAVIPCGTVFDSSGTYVNYETRAQHAVSVRPVSPPIKPAWKWICESGGLCGKIKSPPECLEQLSSRIARSYSLLDALSGIIPKIDDRWNTLHIPRQTARYSGRTAISSHKAVSEPKPPGDADSCFSFSMEGQLNAVPAALLPSYWSPGWNSDQSVTKFIEEISGPLMDGDPGVVLVTSDLSGKWLKPVSKFLKTSAQFPLLLVSVYRIFGSDESSSFSGAIKTRISEFCLYLNKEDAVKFDINENETIRCNSDDFSFTARAEFSQRTAPGIVGIPVGYTDMQAYDTPVAIRLSKDGSA